MLFFAFVVALGNPFYLSFFDVPQTFFVVLFLPLKRAHTDH